MTVLSVKIVAFSLLVILVFGKNVVNDHEQRVVNRDDGLSCPRVAASGNETGRRDGMAVIEQ